jgi:O-antigen/teichoic acid export membrane protein
MKEYVVCKSCGYVMEKGKLHDVCPACGVPAKMFEPYAERLSPRRRLILSLDLHPITVHFTQAFAITLPLLCLAALLVTGLLRATIAATVQVLSCLLPLAAVASVAAGLLDGKVRFRKLTTRLLTRKIVMGTLLFLFALGNLAVVLFVGVDAGPGLYLTLGLTAVCAGLGTLLGLIGVSLRNAKFPG